MSGAMDVYIVGSASTAFRKWPDRDFRDLTAEVLDAALADAGQPDGLGVDYVAFGNCAMGTWGQANIRGQVCLAPAQRGGRLAPDAPIVNVEGGCATGALALHGAVNALRGGAGLALAVGVEKTWVPDDPAKSFALFAGGIDQLHADEWRALFAEQGKASGCGWAPHPARVVFLDVHALQARDHMARFGTTAEQIAAVAARNHRHGARNPKAQYRFEIAPADVLTDKPIVPPLTRAMCSPLSDGAAAVLLASGAWLARHPEARPRAVKVRACTLGGGRWRGLAGPSVVERTAARAYAAAGIAPADVEIVELHDATAACQVLHAEALGFCAEGEGGAYAADDGINGADGARPTNLSGGLISKGHPLAATGLGQIDELVAQLRGEAGERQAARRPGLALAQNAGGLVSFDEALCGVTLLEAIG